MAKTQRREKKTTTLFSVTSGDWMQGAEATVLEFARGRFELKVRTQYRDGRGLRRNHRMLGLSETALGEIAAACAGALAEMARVRRR